MSSLAQIIASLALAGGAFHIVAPEEWAQGRTLFGGMTGALSLGAIRAAFGDLGPLRSVQMSFIGPAAGDLSFRPHLLRRGRSSAVVSVDCHNAEGLAARGTFFFGAARDSVVTHDRVPRLTVPPPEDCPPFSRSSKPPQGFLGRFETRLAAGARILEPGEPPEFAVWVRFRDDEGSDVESAILTIADSLPCAAWVAFPKPAPVSTMSWAVDFHHPLPASGGWYCVSSSSEAAADGYSLQANRVFNAAGEPLATARQVIAIFV